MVKTRILMSTWNGGKYIREQIESILTQKDIEPMLTIRDDGSSDDTVPIIKEMMKDHGNIELIEGKNVGYQSSFLTLLSRDYDESYFAFADQDDVWKEEKISKGIQALGNDSLPRLYLTSLDFVDENLHFLKNRGFHTKFSFWQEVSRHNTAGCTYVFNRALYEIAKKIRITDYKRSYGHDNILSLICCLFGGNIIYDPVSYINFRRHGDNTSSASSSLKKKISKQFSMFGKNKYQRSELLQSLLTNYGSYLDAKTLASIKSVAEYRKHFFSYLKLIFSPKIKSGSLLYDLFLRTLVLFRKY